MATYLRDHYPAPTIIWCSSSCRTRQTLELFLAVGWPTEARVEIRDELYEFSVDRLVHFLRQQNAPNGACLLLLGHNPACTDLINTLTDINPPLQNLPTAGAAWLTTSVWPPTAKNCDLQQIITPKDMAPK